MLAAAAPDLHTPIREVLEKSWRSVGGLCVGYEGLSPETGKQAQDPEGWGTTPIEGDHQWYTGTP